MIRRHDLEGEFRLFDTGQSGKRNPVSSGYIPLHRLHDNCLTSGKHEYPDAHWVWPGETVKARVWLVTPDAYPASLWIGQELDVMEGPARVVGKFIVTDILNEILLRPS